VTKIGDGGAEDMKVNLRVRTLTKCTQATLSRASLSCARTHTVDMSLGFTHAYKEYACDYVMVLRSLNVSLCLYRFAFYGPPTSR
jgi:hypothetical protein